MGDLGGLSNANQLVLDYAQKAGFEDFYQLQEKNNSTGNIDIVPAITLPTAVPKSEDTLNYPVVEAGSAIVIDRETGAILFGNNIDEPRAMASVTKIMTAVVALENIDPDETITIKQEDTNVEPVVMGLLAGEQIKMIDVLRGLLIPSGNDAALALARVGGQGSVTKFIEMMNQKAKVLGLKNTSFANPHGLDQEGQYASARDLALLTNYAMKNRTIAEIVDISETTVSSTDGNLTHYLKTTNQLQDSYLNIQGVKTGFTDNAGQVLITQAEDKGHQIICVVMGSPDRFQESKVLLDWTFNNYYWE